MSLPLQSTGDTQAALSLLRWGGGREKGKGVQCHSFVVVTECGDAPFLTTTVFFKHETLPICCSTQEEEDEQVFKQLLP